ncbi:MAG: class I SAM-dependent methyltransferase [Actinomycetota bacterium]
MDAGQWDERYSKDGLEWGSPPNRFLVRELAEMPPGRALDVAAGEGRNAIWLAEQGWEVTAVDYSRVAVEKGRRWAAERELVIDWIVADVTGFTPVPGSFDLAILFYLQLPPAEWAAVLRTTAAAVAPGGTLLTVGHDRLNLTEGTGGPQEASVLHDVDEIVAVLDGLRIEKAERETRPVEGAERPALDTLVRARRP